MAGPSITVYSLRIRRLTESKSDLKFDYAAGILPPEFHGGEDVAISAEVAARGNPKPERIASHVIRLMAIRNPEVHLSSLTRKDDAFAVVYESFHYLALPRPQDLSCTVIKALGDKFDFLPYYSDFRIDNQEAGTPQRRIAQGQEALYWAPGKISMTCGKATARKAGSNGGTCNRCMWARTRCRERPPEGAPVGSDHDITFYAHQLAESSPDRKILPYNYAMSQMGHEMGHRWSAFVSAKVNGESIQLGPVHSGSRVAGSGCIPVSAGRRSPLSHGGRSLAG